MLVPREVVFNEKGLAVCAGVPCCRYDKQSHPNYRKTVMFLPSENVDFIDYDVFGKTEEQILAETGTAVKDDFVDYCSCGNCAQSRR